MTCSSRGLRRAVQFSRPLCAMAAPRNAKAKRGQIELLDLDQGVSLRYRLFQALVTSTRLGKCVVV